MRTPITYYGGKQQLSKTIIKLIPEHKIYCEPFTGGAAIFFGKEPSKIEILNDTNGELINFYEVLKNDYESLRYEINMSLHSRKQHHHARIIYENPDMFDKIKRAWALWMLSSSSYGGKLNHQGSFGYDRVGTATTNMINKINNFSVNYANRIRNAQIECCDAIRIIKSRDTENTFFYCDPPYVGTDMGHYDGYTQEDFDNLLSISETIKGKFLLSSFRNKSLDDYSKRNGWYSIELKMNCAMSNKNNPRNKIEVLTANYPIVIEGNNESKTV